MLKRELKKQAKNAEKRAVTHLRKLQEIERIIVTEEANKTPAVFIVDKIKEVINPAKDK
jgi:chemotaxis signal transduction protein